MGKNKYTDLFEIIPFIKTIIDNKKRLTVKEKKCLDFISDYYKKNKIIINKIQLRNYFKKKRNLLHNDFIKKKSLILNKKIIKSKEYKSAQTIFCYISFDKEIDTNHLIIHSLKLKKKVCVPYITNKKTMIAAEITSFENLRENKYGILEPENAIEIKKESIDLIIVPALSYNPLGFRLGYGAGFYDNYLKNYKGMTFGMALREFLSCRIIPEKHDVPVTKLFIE